MGHLLPNSATSSNEPGKRGRWTGLNCSKPKRRGIFATGVKESVGHKIGSTAASSMGSSWSNGELEETNSLTLGQLSLVG